MSLLSALPHLKLVIVSITYKSVCIIHFRLPSEPGRVGNLVAIFDTMPDFNAGTRMLTVDITITWTQPMYPNGVIQNYNVTVFETANPSNMVYNDSTLIDPNVTTSVIVLPFTDYTVSVAASTSAGQGEEETVTLTSPEAGRSLTHSTIVYDSSSVLKIHLQFLLCVYIRLTRPHFIKFSWFALKTVEYIFRRAEEWMV